MMPPPEARTTTEKVPVGVPLAVEIVSLETPEPGAGSGMGEKVPVAWSGSPETVKLMGVLRPPLTVVVRETVPEPPREMESVEGEAETVNPGTVEVPTDSERTAVRVRPPPVAVTVNA